MPDAFPSSIRQFIGRNLHSVEQLEILLLVRTRRDPVWTIKQVYDVILSGMPSVERALEGFTRLGFLEKSNEPAGYRYVASDAVDAEVEQLAQLYRIKPARVIEAIFRRDRDPAQGFADSFKINPES